jgi:pilus assembly protein CpaB
MDRQRTILLFAAAAVMAGLLSWFLYAETVAPQQERRTAVMAAAHNLAVGQMVRKADLKKVMLLARDIPAGAVYTEAQAIDRVALYPVSANAPLIAGGLSPLSGAEGIPSTIDPGYRAVSVTISDVSGVAGLIQPGSHVDVLFTRPGTMAEAITSTILQNVRVLAIGHVVQIGQVVDPKAPKAPVATLVVTPEEAQRLELAKNEGRISLSLRNPLDQSAGVDGKPVSTEVLNPAMRGRIQSAGSVRRPNPKAWEELSVPPSKLAPINAKAALTPPPPPRAVVDVFRGDKHVQEVFRE